MLLTCPICHSTLSKEERTYKCNNRHSYDIAKEGYVNLLPVQNKKSKNPGDNAEMINARRQFLQIGFYYPLVEEITKSISNKHNTILLDSGCGEGYYSNAIANNIESIKVLGFDISKNAVKKASKKNKDHTYFVSNVNNIPIIERSINYILTVFAPIDEKEFNKVLKDDGKLIIVSAGPNHMKEIAEIIYDQFKPHNYDPIKSLSSFFVLQQKIPFTFSITLDNKEDRLNMLKMTPYYWSSDTQDLNKIINKTSMNITCDFQIQIYAKQKIHTSI